MDENLLSIQEAAKKLKASTKTLRRWEERGILVPQRTAGSHRRYTKDQIEKFIQDQKAKKLLAHSIPVAQPIGLPLAVPTSAGEEGFYPDEKNIEASQEFLTKTQDKFTSKDLKSKLSNFSLSSKQKIILTGSIASFACLLLFVLTLKTLPIGEGLFAKQTTVNNTLVAQKIAKEQDVLAASTAQQKFVLNVNVPATFLKTSNFVEGLEIDGRAVLAAQGEGGSFIDLGSGTITASNIVYSVTAGDGISVTPGQNPIISNTGVLSIGGQSGAVSLTAGSGISISGNTITNTSPGTAAPDSFSNIVVGSDTVAAGGSNATLNLDAGSGISLVANTGSKTITISASGGISSPWEENAGVVSLVNPGTVTTIDMSPLNGTGEVSLNVGTLTVNGQGGVTQSSPSCVTTVNGIVTGFGTCQLGSEQWVASNGTLYPGVTSYDLLIGGTSTASAKFAVLNMAAGTPVASLSGTTNGVALSGNGTIQSLRNGTLTLGGNTTGNISLLPGSGTGFVGIGTSNPTSTLDVQGSIRLGAAGVNNILSTTPAGGSPTGDLYWGSRTLCDNSGNCTGSGAGIGGSGTTNRGTKFTSAFNVGNSSIYDVYGGGVALTFDTLGHVGIGTGTPAGLFDVEGAPPNGALAVFNYTGSGQNIITASASGVSVFNVDQSGNVNLASGGSYYVNGSSVLSATTLGAGVINSSLTSVGTLTSGVWNATAISSQFGGTGINTSSSTGVPYISSGTWSVDSNFLTVAHGGTGAGSYTANGIIYGNGTNALQVTGAAANSILATDGSNIPSLTQTLPTAVQDNITRLGTIVSGVWNGTVIGTQYGGTGQNFSGTAQGSIPYFSNTGVMSALGPGTAGYILTTNGAGANPSWVSASSVGTNYWQLNSGALAPNDASYDLLVGGAASASAKFRVNAGNGNLTLANGAEIMPLSDSSTALRVANSTGTTLATFDTTNSRVGIGNSAPQSLLDMTSSVNLPVLTMGYRGAPSLGSTFASIDFNTSYTSNWAVSNDTTQTSIRSIAIDTDNNIVYAGSGTGGIIYRCDAGATNCDASGDWTTAYDTTENTIYSLFYDPYTHTMFAGTGNNGIIYRCDTSSGCDTSTDWTTSYDTADLIIYSFGEDTTNHVLYAGSNGHLFRCALSTLCDSSSDWTTAYTPGTSDTSINGITFDSAGGKLYLARGATSIVAGHIDSCDISSGCDQDSDFSVVYSAPSSVDIKSITIDTAHRVLYAGRGNSGGGGIIRCDIQSTGCDASGDWTTVNSTGNDYYSMNYDSYNGIVYAGVQINSGAIAYACATSTGCSTNGDFATSLSTGEDIIYSLASNPSDGQAYAGSNPNGIIYVRLGSSSLKTYGRFKVAATDLTSGSEDSTITLANEAGGTLQDIFSIASANVGIGSTTPISAFYVTHPLAFGATGKALAIFNQIENQDIFTASASGVAKFTITNAGGIKLGTNEGTASQCLLSGGPGSAAVWSTCPGGSGTTQWDIANGAIFSGNSTLDLLLGGSATASAKFGVLNINSGTPTASISAGSTGASYLTAAGNLATTAFQTLTLGGSTTGNITLNPNGGSGITSSTGTFNIASGKTYQISGVDVLSSTTLGSSVVNSSLTSVGTITSGTWNGTAIAAQYGGTGIDTSSSTGVPYINSGTWSVDTNFLNVAHGGTGVGSLATNGILYGNNTGAVQVTAAAANSILVTDGSNVPSLSQTLPTSVQDNITRLGTIVSGVWNGTVIGTQYGGTGQDFSSTAQGSIPYFSATGVLSALGPSTSGYVLATGGPGANPTWINPTALGTNYWSLNNGALSPNNSTVDLLIGGSTSDSAKFAVLNVNSGTPTASVSGATGASYLTADGNFGTTNKQTLTIGGANSGNIYLSSPAVSLTGGLLQSTTSNLSLKVGGGSTSVFQGDLSSTTIYGGGTGAFLANSSTTSLLGGGQFVFQADSSSTSLKAGGGNTFLTGSSSNVTLTSLSNTDVIISPNGTGDIQLVNDGDTSIIMSGFTNNGGILYTNGSGVLAQTGAGSTSQCLTGGATPSWASCQGGSLDAFWNQANGALFSNNSTVDFLIGGQSTDSAKFAVINVNSGTPTATISAGSAGGAYLSANGVLATTSKQSLTLGDANTGNLILNGFTGNNGILYGIAGTGKLAQAVTSSSGLCLMSNGSPFAPSWQACPGSGSGASKWTLNGNIIYPNSIDQQVAIGTQTPSDAISSLYVTHDLTSGALGTAVAIFNQTENQDLISASSSGTPVFTVKQNGNLQILDGAGLNYATITVGSLGANRAYNLPSYSGTTADICLSTGNCAGTGGGIVGSGTTNRIAKFASTGSIADSSINDLYNGGVALTFGALGNVGIGNTNPTGFFNVNGSVPGQALAVLNYTGSGQNIIAASASGATVFTLDQSGNVNIANGAAYSINNSQVLSATTLGSTVVNSSLTSVGTIASGTWNGTAIAAQYGGTGIDTSSSTGVPYINSGTWGVDTNYLGVNHGGTGVGTLATNGILFGNGTGAVQVTAAAANSILATNGSNIPSLTQTLPNAVQDNITRLGTVTSGVWNGTAIGTQYGGTGQNFSATAQGSIPYFSATGVLSALGPGTVNYCLTSGGVGANPIWQSCAIGSGTNFWQLNNNLLSPNNSTYDVAFGGTASTSAKFAFLNIAGGTPTASISANTTGAYSFLTGTGNLGTTNGQTLTLGGDTTGLIKINNKAGNTFATFDTVNGKLGVGSATKPTWAFEVNSATDPRVAITNPNSGGVTWSLISATNTLHGVPNGDFLIHDGTDNIFTVSSSQNTVGINTTGTDGALEINSTGNHLRLSYNDPNGGATNYTDFSVNSSGDLSITPSGLDVTQVGSLFTVNNNATGNQYSMLGVKGNAREYRIGVGSSTESTFGVANKLFFYDSTTGVMRAAFDTLGNYSLGTVSPSTLSELFVTRPLSFGANGKALAIFDQIENQDILSASKSGITEFTINSNGNLQFRGGTSFLNTLTSAATAARTYTFPDATGTVCLDTNNCGFLTGNFWQLNNNLLSPGNSTYDFAIGGTTSTSAKFAFLNVAGGTPVASISANTTGAYSFLTGAGNLGTTNFQTLTLGGATTGLTKILNSSGNPFATFDPFNNGLYLGAQGSINGLLTFYSSGGGTAPTISADSSKNLNITAPSGTVTVGNGTGDINLDPGAGNLIANLSDIGDFLIQRAGTTFATFSHTGTEFSVSGGTTGGQAVAVFNQDGASTNDILAASASGITKFAINNNGNLQFAGNTSVLNTITSSATTARTYTFPDLDGTVCLSTSTGCIPGATNYWQFNNGAVSPFVSNVDVLIGGTSTSSAKFGFLNNASGTPTASVSAGTNGASYLTADGNLATTAFQTLTIGGATTGNISINNNLFATGHSVFGNDITTIDADRTLLVSETVTNNSGSKTGIRSVLTANPSADSTAGYFGNSSRATDTNGTGFDVAQLTGYSATAVHQGVTGSTVGNAYGFIGQISNTNTGDITNASVFQASNPINSGGGTITNAYDFWGDYITNGTNKYGLYLSDSVAGPALTGNFGIYAETDYQNVLVGNTRIGANSVPTTALDVVGQGLFTATTATGVSPAILTVTGGIANNAALIVNNNNSGDLIVASASGSTKFQLTNAGVLRLAGGQISDFDTLTNTTLNIGGTNATTLTLGRSGQGITLPGFTTNNNTVLTTNGSGVLSQVTTTTAGQCLVSNAAGNAPSWTTCPGGSGFTQWNLANGAIFSGNSTLDLLLGGSATASAKFAVLNMNSGTPTASVSAGATGGAYVNAAGLIATTARQTLTLGDANTGNIILNPNGTSKVGIGNSAPTAALDILSTTATGNTVAIANNSLTSGNALNISSTSQMTSGNLLALNNTTTYTTPIANSGNGINLARALTVNIAASNPTIDASSSASTNPASSATWSHTVGNGSGRYLVVAVDIGNTSTTVTGVTYDSVAMTQLGTTTGSTSRVYLFGLANPNSGTHNVVASYSGSAFTKVGASSWTNVDQSNPTGTYASNTTTATSTTTNVSSSSTDMVVDTYAIANQLSPTPNAGVNQAVMWNDGVNVSGGGSYKTGSTTTTAMTWSHTNNLAWTQAGIALHASTTTGLDLTGALASFSSNCTITTGACNDSSNILSLTQSYAQSTGAALNIANAGFGIGLNLSSNSGGQSALVINKTGNSGDILTASASGTTKFKLDLSGNLSFAGGQNVLTTIASANTTARTISIPLTGSNDTFCLQTLGNCAGTNYWQLNNNLLSPNNSTYDVAFGGTSTASAKFAFLNIAGGTPTASISANSGGGALFMTGTGTIGTTARQTLTLGSATSGGDVSILGGNASVSNGNGFAVNIRGGAGADATGNGGALNLTGGAAGSSGLGGGINLTGGAPAPSNGGIGSAIALTAGAGSSGSGGGFAGGAITLTAGIGGAPIGGTAGSGGAITLTAGQGGSNGTGGALSLTTGAGGATSGASGALTLGTGAVTSGAFGTISFKQGSNTRAFIDAIGNFQLGTTSGNSQLYVTRALSAGANGKALAILDQIENQDILTASKSGVTKFTIDSSGNLSFAGGQNVLTTIASANTTARTISIPLTGSNDTFCLQTANNCGGTNYWQLNSNLLSPNNSTYDFAVGGTASNAAKFAVLGVASNTPVATLSGSTGGAYLSAAGTLATTNKQSLNLADTNTGNINIGTDATARTISLGNATGATALNLTSGTGSQTFTSSNATGLTTGGAFVFTDNSLNTGTGLYLNSTSLTTGKLAQLSTGAANTLTSGTVLDLRSTTTALTGAIGTGSLLNLDWSPGSATIATGDLFALNIGGNGSTTGNLFNILSAGSSLFSVSQTAVTSNLPVSFNAAGDISAAYDLAFTNPTASNIKSAAPLALIAGETFGSSNLTLQTYNWGQVDLEANGGVITNVNNGGVAAFTINNNGNGDLLTASASGTTKFRISNGGDVTIIGSTTTCTLGNGSSATSCSASDQRLKTNINNLPTLDGLDAVMALNPVSFNWNSWMQQENGASPTQQFGFIAQQVQTVLPNLVSQDPNSGFYKLDYQGLFAPIIKAIQQQQVQINSLGQITSPTYNHVTAQSVDAGSINVQELSVNDATISGELTVNSIHATSLDLPRSAWQTALSNGALEDITNSVLADGSSIFESTASADLKFAFLDNKISSVSANIDHISQVLADLNISGFATDSGELTSIDNLMVAGTTTLAEASISNNLTVGNDLTINSNSINTINNDLEIQPLNQAGINFLGGKITFDTDGNISVSGNLAVTGDVTVGGVLAAHDVAVGRADVTTLSDTEIIATGSSALVTLKSGETELKIDNQGATQSSLIFLTPKTESSLPIYIKEQNDGDFTVGIKQAQADDIKFNFLIVN